MPDLQSDIALHFRPSPQGGHVLPQSRSTSEGPSRLSEQVGTLHLPSTHQFVAQSCAPEHFCLNVQPSQEPPQSWSVSSPSRRPFPQCPGRTSD